MDDPNRLQWGDKYHKSSKLEKRQIKAMLGMPDDPPGPPFKPKFDPDTIYRHDDRGFKTERPLWDPTNREWKIKHQPAPSRIDYSDSEIAQGLAFFFERQTDLEYARYQFELPDQQAPVIDQYVA